MRSIHLAALLIAIALPVQAGAGPKITTNTAPGASFAAYRTYSWVDDRMRMPSGMNPINYQRIQSDIEAALAQKGYQKGSPGDLTVVLTVGTRQHVDLDNGWYWGWAGEAATYTEGQLSIDVFDTKSKQAVWHGQATDTIDRNKPKPEKADAAVTEIMSGFPAMSASAQ